MDSSFSSEKEPFYPEENTTGQNFGTEHRWSREKSQKGPYSGKDITSMILGILSLVFVCCCAPVALIAGISAVILALCCRGNGKKLPGTATAGLVCGVLGILLNGILLGVVLWMLLHGEELAGQWFLPFENINSGVKMFSYENLFPGIGSGMKL